MIKDLDILRNTDLVTQDNLSFLNEHKENFENRLRTRSLFRSKFEIEASVLREDEHPTDDSKYWQAIGESTVQLQELITLSYENGKHEADLELLEAEIEELEDSLLYAEKSFETKKIEAKIKKKRIELEQGRFNSILQKKTAKERMREIVTWEEIISKLEPELKYGSEDFELHHPERYLKRYQIKMDRMDMLSDEEKENTLSHYNSFVEHQPEGRRILPKPGHEILSPPEKSSHEEYKDEDDMLKNEKIVKQFFERETNTILIGTPHRLREDENVSDLHKLQHPAGMSAMLEEPYGFSVADARNMIVKKAIDRNFDYLFFIDDDVIVPRTVLVTLMEHLRNGYDIASGFYYRKYKPLESCPMMEDENGRPSRVEFDKIGETFDDVLVACSGCTLFKIDVFKRIDAPWYKEVFVNGQAQVTEDSYMCQQIRNVEEPKIKSILDTGVQCLHVDQAKGIFYGHEDIVQNNVVVEAYREFFAV